MARPKKKTKAQLKMCEQCETNVVCELCGGTRPTSEIQVGWYHHQVTPRITYHTCGTVCEQALHQHENGYPYQ